MTDEQNTDSPAQPERGVPDPNDAPPIVVSSAQLADMRNGSDPQNTAQSAAQSTPPEAHVPHVMREPYHEPTIGGKRIRRPLVAARARISYRADGRFVIVVGDEAAGKREYALDSAYRFALLHGGDGALPTLVVWVNEADPSGAMPPTAPLDIPVAEVVDVEQLKLTLHRQGTLIAYLRSAGRRAATEAIRLTLVTLGHHDIGHPFARIDLPNGFTVADIANITDNAVLRAFGEYTIARQSIDDALARAQIALGDLETVKQAGVVSGDELHDVLDDVHHALAQLMESAAWLALEHAAADIARDEPTLALGPEETEREIERRADERATAIVSERVRKLDEQREHMAAMPEPVVDALAVDAERMTGAQDFADWLVGPSGPPVMRAKTASQREQLTADLVETWQQVRAREAAGDGSDGNNPADEPGAR